LQDANGAEEEALRRVVEAERAATQAGETAVRLRSRAQRLMAKAELVAYKSIMALRIAEAARISDSSRDLVLTTLD
jgi:putative heme degradation protein